MTHRTVSLLIDELPLHHVSTSIAEAVSALRRARGIANPEDFEVGSTEWHASCASFVLDQSIYMGIAVDDIPTTFSR